MDPHLPRLEAAIREEVMDERLRDGLETLQVHRVLELARAMRDGESQWKNNQGPSPLQRNRVGQPEGGRRRVQRREEFTRMDQIDAQIDEVERKERKMKTGDKSYSVVIDRRTHKSLMLAKTRLPKLDCAHAVSSAAAAAPGQDGPLSNRGGADDARRRRDDREHARRGVHCRAGDGAQTERSRRIEDREVRMPALAHKVVKASDEVTQWKRQRRGGRKSSRLEAHGPKPMQLAPMKMTWKTRVKETQASHEVTEWRGFKRFEKLERSWLDSEQEFRALLASFELSRRGGHAAEGKAPRGDPTEDEGSSFFLTSATMEEQPDPHSRERQKIRKQARGSDGASSEDEDEENPSQIVRPRLSVVAPSMAQGHSSDESEDDFIDASALRLRKAGAANPAREQPEPERADAAAAVVAAAEEAEKRQRDEAAAAAQEQVSAEAAAAVFTAAEGQRGEVEAVAAAAGEQEKFNPAGSAEVCQFVSDSTKEIVAEHAVDGGVEREHEQAVDGGVEREHEQAVDGGVEREHDSADPIGEVTAQDAGSSDWTRSKQTREQA